MAGEDIVRGLFPEAQAAVARRVQEILDAVVAQEVDRLDAYHFFGPKFSKFDDNPPLERQDAATTQRLERELVLGAETLDFRHHDLKVDVFGPAAVATFLLDWGATMPDGTSFAGTARATLVFVDDAGEWKIAHEHFSPYAAGA